MSTLFVFLSSLIRVYTISILSSLIRVYTICHFQQSDQGLHYLPLSAVWSGSTLFAILSKQYYQVYTVCHSQHSDQSLHYLPFSAVLIKVKGYTVILRNNLIRVYTICQSQQSGQGLHYLPFLAIWSRSRSTLSFSGTVWSGSTLFVILKSLIWIFTVCHFQQSDQRVHCHSQQSNQGLYCLPFSVWSWSTLFAILSSLMRVYTIYHSPSDHGLHYLPFSG